MPYIICNDTKYLRQGNKGYSLTNNPNEATKWSKVKSANNTLKHIESKFIGCNLEVKAVLQDSNVVSATLQPDELDYDILEKAGEIAELAKQAENRKAYLCEQIHNVDLEIVDIEHAAEFYNLNAAQGYKLYRMLHDARVERRKLKDELERINMFLGTSIGSDKMENLKKSIMGLDNRQYTPRVNKELFGV